MYKSETELEIEKKNLEEIYKISDIINQLQKRDQDVKVLVNYMQEVQPSFKDKF